MIGLKKFVSNELLQIALLLSLIRHRGDHLINNNIEYESPTVGVGGRSEWNQTVYVSHNPTIHPKSIVNYHEDLIHELNSLGRYNRIDFTSDVTAYLLNVNDTAGSLPLPSGGEGGGLPSQPAASTTEAGNENDPGLDTGDDGKGGELSKEDMAIIETLWKEDASRVGVVTGTLRAGALSVGGATNSNDTDPDPSSSTTEETFDDGISGGHLGATGCAAQASSHLVAEFQYNGQLSPSSSKSLDHADLDFCKNFDSDDYFPATLDELYPPSKKSFFDIDPGNLDLDLKPECLDEDESAFLLAREDDSLGLFSYPKDDFLISNALELCELNDCCDQGASSTVSVDIKEEKEENKELEELDLLFEMMQTAPYHSSRAYHQSRVPYVRSALGIPPPSTSDPAHHQRWQDYQNSSSYPHHHHHHHHGHLPYGHAGNISSYSHHSHGQEGGLTSALIHNATLPPPMGDLNNTSPYHIGASPNLGSAVTSSMNLTNCDNEHSIMNSAAAGYKMDNDSVFYQHNISNQSLNNQTESFFPSILNDEDLQLMDMAMNESMYGNMLDNVTASSSPHTAPPTLASSSLGLVAPHNAAAATLVAADRCTDSDSAVSSMGSERVPSLSSDNEWMETNSDSGHTPGDHYSAEYSKYRWYDNYMYLRSHSMGNDSPSSSSSSHRLPPPAVAQKKYQLYGRRLFHDHNSTAASTSSDISSVDSAHIKYELNDTESSRVDEARYNSSDEVKYSCMAEFSRTSHRPSLSELVTHNHTYSSSSLATSLPQESLGATSRNYMKDKTAKYIQKLKMVDFAARKSEEEQMTRDEKKARALNVPIPVHDIINLPMDEFNERLSKYDLSETQLSLIRDIRRRGKNKVAAQNCRKRKLDQILSLADEVKQMKDKKRHLCQEHEYLSQETLRVKSRFSQLYKHVFNALRDSDGNPYSPFEFSLEQTNDGNVELVRRSSSHLAGHASTSSKDNAGNSTGAGSHSHDGNHYRSKHHKDYHDHRKE